MKHNEDKAKTVAQNIWGSGSLAATCYFRKTFSLAGPAKRAILRIFVDTGYELYINGLFVSELDEWNNTRDYDVLDFLASGLNVIAVRAFNHGGHRGFALELDVVLKSGEKNSIISDASWLASPHETWSWKSVAFDDSEWQNARRLELEDVGAVQWRDCPGEDPAKIIPCLGNSLFFQEGLPKHVRSPFETNRPTPVEKLPILLEMIGEEYQDNLLACPPNIQRPLSIMESGRGDGSMKNVQGLLRSNSGGGIVRATSQGVVPFAIVDFGEETVGYLRLKTTSEAAVTFRLTYGETLNNCHYPPSCCSLLHRMLVEKVSLEAGIHEWESRMRQGFRYVKIEFLNCESTVQVEGVSVKTSLYPLFYKGYFACSDPLLTKIWQAGRKTLHLCMQEYYLDGIKRDRFLWVADARVEALVNYYAFGDRELFCHSWRALAKVQYADGGIPSVLGEGASMLWDYVAWWVIAFGDYYLYTGDLALIRELKEPLLEAVNWLILKSGDDGLIDVPENKTESWMCVLNKKAGKDFNLNALFYRSLRTVAQLMEALSLPELVTKYQKLAEKTKEAFDRLPGSPGLDSFVPEYDNYPSGSIDCLEIIDDYFKHGRALEGMHFIRQNWGGMLNAGSDTFWEAPIEKPALAVGETGTRFDSMSHCHGWTAGPTYALLAYVAGITPTAPGFLTFAIKPQMESLVFVKGVVPTPHGPLAVLFERARGCFKATILVPEGTSGRLILPQKQQAAVSLKLDGNEKAPVSYYNDEQGICTLCIELSAAGQYSLSIKAPD